MRKSKIIKTIEELCTDNSDSFIADIVDTLDLWGSIISPRPELNYDSFFRKEANVITHYCFRRTHIESIHAESVPFDDKAMKRLMLESSGKMCEWMK